VLHLHPQFNTATNHRKQLVQSKEQPNGFYCNQQTLNYIDKKMQVN